MLKKIKIEYIFGLFITLLLLCLSVPAIAAPEAANALDPARSNWRNYYRDKFFIDMHSFTAMSTLLEFSTEDEKVTEAITKRLDGNWKESIEILRDMTSDPDLPNSDEVIYALGLVYESLAFFPEAMGNYARIKYDDTKGDFYHKTILRKSYVKFISALKYKSLKNMVDADGGFYKVFKKSEDERDWRDALAGHAVMLYYFGAHESAEEIFSVLAEDGSLRPAYLFARAENFLNMGQHQFARNAFQSLQDFLKGTEKSELQSYIFLRLGDVASMRDEIDDAKSFYNIIPVVSEEGKPMSLDEAFIMQTMAAGELLMRTEKYQAAIALFDKISDGPFPIGLDLRETVALNLVLLYAMAEMEIEAFSSAKEFTLLYPDNHYIPEVNTIINDYIFKLFSGLYEALDYNNILNHYFENIRFVKEKRSLMILGDVLLQVKLPTEAQVIHKDILDRFDAYHDTDVLTGLASAYLLQGEVADVEKYLRKAQRTKDKGELLKVATVWRSLGDYYYRNSEAELARRAYSFARGSITDDALDLRSAALLSSLGKKNSAIKLYTKVLRRSSSKESKKSSLIGVANIYAEIKRPKRALKNYKLALKYASDGTFGEIYYKIGEMNLRIKRNKTALASWKKAVKANDNVYYRKLSEERIREAEAWDQARM